MRTILPATSSTRETLAHAPYCDTLDHEAARAIMGDLPCSTAVRHLTLDGVTASGYYSDGRLAMEVTVRASRMNSADAAVLVAWLTALSATA